MNYVNWVYAVRRTRRLRSSRSGATRPLLGVVPDRQPHHPGDHRVAFGAWLLGWTGTLFLSSTRMIFAAAFDRVLPEWAAACPTAACPGRRSLLIMIPSVVLSWFYAYKPDFYPLTLDATLVIAVTFLGSLVRGDDPAVVEEGHLPRLAGRALRARSGCH